MIVWINISTHVIEILKRSTPKKLKYLEKRVSAKAQQYKLK